MSKAFAIEVDIYPTDDEDYERIIDEIMSIPRVDSVSGKQWAAIPDTPEDES